MARRRNNQSEQSKSNDIPKKENWYEKSFNRTILFLGGIATLFTSGFYIGDFKKDLENKLELITLKQECNNLVQAEKDKCSDLRKEIENKRLEELSTTIKELSKIKGGKYEK